MTPKVLKEQPPREFSPVAPATEEEKEVLLRRAILIRHGETDYGERPEPLPGRSRDQALERSAHDLVSAAGRDQLRLLGDIPCQSC